MAVRPYVARRTSETLGGSLSISIPSKKLWFQILFLGFWLIGWTFGEVMVGGILFRALFTGDQSFAPILAGPGLFLVAWLGLWTIGGAFAIYAFIWQVSGKEIIEINSQTIKISRDVFGFRLPKEYNAQYIKDLRISNTLPSDMFGWSRMYSAWGLGTRLLAFDYGAKTIRFGSGVDEAEAKQIVAEIQQIFPQYRT